MVYCYCYKIVRSAYADIVYSAYTARQPQFSLALQTVVTL